MAELPPFPILPDALRDEIPCILCHRLPTKEHLTITNLLDEGWQQAESNTRKLGLLKYKHTQWLPEPRITLHHLYRLGTYLNGKSIITWVALDALSGRNQTVILAQYEPHGECLQLGRLTAKDTATKLSKVINGFKAFKDVVDDGNITLLREFEVRYGDKDGIPRASTPLEKLPEVVLSDEYSDRDVTIVSISPFTSDDQQSILHRCTDKMQPDFENVNFVTWQNELTATRTDIFNILFKANQWEHDGAMVEHRYVLFMDSAALQDHEIIVAHARKYNSDGAWDADRSVILFRASLSDIGKIWKAIRIGEDAETPLDAEHYAMDKSSEEKIRNPDAEFGRRKPVFLPQEEPDGGSPALFFLKSDFTVKEKETIMDELLPAAESYFDDDCGTHYCLVPWIEDEEGTAEDIVEIMAYLTVNAQYEGRYPIFIDGQTARDRTVIMAQWEDDEYGMDPVDKKSANMEEYEGKPGYKQIQWGRIAGREAHINWVGLDVANQSFDDETIEVEKLQIVVKSDEEIEELAKKVMLPEDEGDWREIWNAYALQHMETHEDGDKKQEEEESEEGIDLEPDDAGEGPSRKKPRR